MNNFDKLVAVNEMSGDPKVFGIHLLGTNSMAIHLIVEIFQTVTLSYKSPLPLFLMLHQLKTNEPTSIKMTKVRLKPTSLFELHIFGSKALPSLIGH